MNKFYDKLLLLLGLLALLGGGAFYMVTTGEVADVGGDVFLQPADNPYRLIPVPESVARDASWPEPEHQSSGPDWLYDVFTPPKIYLDAQREFTAKPPRAIAPPPPFGIYLAEMERIPFRIQMQGFSGDRNKPEEAVLFIFDEEREVRFFIRKGESNEESEIEVLDFSISRQIDDDGNVQVIAFATIIDGRTGDEIRLDDGSRLFETEIMLVFRSEQDRSIKVALELDPDEPVTSFETPLGKYILQEINLEERSVTVKKQATDDHESEIRVLSPRTFIEPEEPESDDLPLETPDDEDEFESFFR